MSFVDEYIQILKNGYEKIIYFHDATSKVYDYKGFTHCNTETWKEEFVDLILKNLLNYCYETKEIESLYSPKFPGLENYIIKATRDRLNNKTKQPQQDGLCGELLIDLILRMENINNKTLLCRPKYQQKGAKAELKNYDVLIFNDEGAKVKLLLGQVKSGKYDYCTVKMEEDLNTKYTNTYFGDAVCYIADRLLTDNPSEVLLNLLKDINDIALGTTDKKIRNDKICEYIKANQIKVEIPCLLLYSNDAVYEVNSQIKEKISKEISKIEEFFDSKSFNIQEFDFNIVFYVFPAKSVNDLRESIMNYKREVLND